LPSLLTWVRWRDVPVLARSGEFLYIHAMVESVKTRPDLAGIRELAKEIAAMFTPKRIVLFGSLARGTAGAESDADLLVLVEGDEPPLRLAARINASIDHPFPIDILVWRTSRFDESLRRGGSFATEVARSGVVLYEA